MTFEFIFLTLFIAGWAICGVFPWLVASVWTRGNAGLVFLPVSMATAVLFGLLVPFIGGTGVTGIWLSFAAAFAGPSMLLLARRISVSSTTAGRERRPTPANPTSPGRPE